MFYMAHFTLLVTVQFDDFISLVQDKIFFLSLRAGGVLQVLQSDWFRERECLLSVNEQKA